MLELLLQPLYLSLPLAAPLVAILLQSNHVKPEFGGGIGHQGDVRMISLLCTVQCTHWLHASSTQQRQCTCCAFDSGARALRALCTAARALSAACSTQQKLQPLLSRLQACLEQRTTGAADSWCVRILSHAASIDNMSILKTNNKKQ